MRRTCSSKYRVVFTSLPEVYYTTISQHPLGSEAISFESDRDTAEDSRRLKWITDTTLPVLLDRRLDVARRYDFRPKPGQPMGGMRGVAQMGFVIADARGVIRVQRVDIYFGQHAGQMLEILRLLGQHAQLRPGAPLGAALASAEGEANLGR